MPDIKLSLNLKSIDAAIKEVERYREQVKTSDERLVLKLVDQGTKQAQQIAMYMNAYDSGELVNGIVGTQSGTAGEITSTAPHSAYVEFGTGIRGEQSQHPNPGLAGWKYDINEHGEFGWWYMGDDGRWHWTKGMPSRPYMYDTAQILRQSIPYVAKEVIKK